MFGIQNKRGRLACLPCDYDPVTQPFRKGREKDGACLDLVLVGGWPVLFLVMLSSLRVSYPFAFGAEGWVRTGVTQAAGGWILVFGAWPSLIFGPDSALLLLPSEGVGAEGALRS